ncbi:type I polyketide synthase [Candidatus Protofrankia californiensis]|uniref:Type I polyketide synthase n=1 Tax=Candidatus Protofrankia californiensis TaxID=1839754 RepID=A0A1C3NYP9_9ACTN|nr:type I polyketide synthase [Candidatus Protofrankia californiensis]
MELPDGAGSLFTGLLTAQSHPWLADHRVDGRTLVPAAVLLELVRAAGAALGRTRVDDLVVHSPVVLDDAGPAVFQVTVPPSGQSHLRARSGEPDRGGDWTTHVTAQLTATEPADAAPGTSGAAAAAEPWQPTGERLDLGEVAATYALLADHGYQYGPAFQGLRAAWRDGDELYAEIELPAPVATDAAGYDLHPVLVDVALHVLALRSVGGPRRVPYALDGARIHAPAARQACVRFRLIAPDTYRLELGGLDGTPLLTVDRLRLRALTSQSALYQLVWSEAARDEAGAGQSVGGELAAVAPAGAVPAQVTGEGAVGAEAPGAAEAPSVADLDALLAESGAALPSTVHLYQAPGGDPGVVANAARLAVTRWLADGRTEASRLVFVTRGGVATQAGEVADPGTAAMWGLVQSAQAEYPDRFALLDVDTAAPVTPDATLSADAALPSAAPRAVVRGGRVLHPRLEPVLPARPNDPARPDGAEGAEGASRSLLPRSAAGGGVLITGGIGALGRELARHLVVRHGVRTLVLVSRSGPAHPEASATEAELAALGARVLVRACDVTRRDDLAALIADLDVPLSAVVHAAGTLEDAVVERLSADAVARVVAVKADAARHLDELTRDADLDAFVLFGSVAGILGTAGQGNYAAANRALDAVGHERHRAGRPTVTIHWGPWDLAAGMVGKLTERDEARLDRAGIGSITVEEGLALFDEALTAAAPTVVAAKLHPHALAPAERTASTRARARARLAAGGAGTVGPGSDVDVAGVLLDTVAEVLGHASRADVDADRAFVELGFDSLLAVELRNRLNAALGVTLPSTVVFDHPSPAALTRLLVELRNAADPARSGGVDGTSTDVRDGAEAATGAARTASAEDPIAIVGMACRLPGGVRTPADLWRLVAAGTDAITEFPDDRGWDPDLFDPDPERVGTSYVRHGGFLHDAAEFDAEFFGISRREALAVDPQQRLLLETAWEAVEDAGIDPTSLRGTPSGVFVGVMYSDYGARIHQRRGGTHELEGYLVAGSAGSVASGRVAYVLGLEGPAVTVDTACSSSLVAMHQAARSLRLGESSLALAGGVTVMASPATFVEFSRQRGLAPDGRCKPFAAAADGTAWAEGVGVVVLERLSDARRNGHRVLALLRGSAVNSDGASNGLTAPNGPSQERVIRAALRDADLSAGEVDVLEAHGTGTRLGDPIEAGAVHATYGRDRGEQGHPLLMGSVKSNLGHTQAAAGVTAVIKLVQAMHHGAVPATLHHDRPSEHVDWSAGTVTVPTTLLPWPETGRLRRAAASSFGISGTNAHVILERAPEDVRAPVDGPAGAPGGSAPADGTGDLGGSASAVGIGAPGGSAPADGTGEPGHDAVVAPRPAAGDDNGPLLPWVLSARTPDGLRRQAVRLRQHLLDEPAARAADVALSLATTRGAFEHRAVVLGRTREELITGLERIAALDPAAALLSGPVTGPVAGPGPVTAGSAGTSDALPLVFAGRTVAGARAVLFSGQGSQRLGMGTTLYRAFAGYADVYDAVCDEFLRVAGLDVRAVVSGPDDGRIDQTRYTQATLFAVEVALFRLLESWGLAADLVAGHSIGEIAAAHVSGALGLTDAVALVAARGGLMDELPPGGAMVAVRAPAEQVRELAAQAGAAVDVAAVNGPRSVVLSGDETEVERLVAVLADAGLRARRLTVSHAFHSARMDPMLERFRAAAGDPATGPMTRILVSTLTGREADARTLGSAAHWVDQVRGTVRFADALTRLRDLGAATFLEVGPDAVLAPMAEEADLGDGVVALPTLDRRHDELAALGSFVARSFVAGVAWDWRAILGPRAVTVPLPTYAFARERLWLDPPTEQAGAAALGLDVPDHPLLSAAVDLRDGASVYTGVLSTRRQPWLADHAVYGVPLLPAAAIVDLLGWLAARVGLAAVDELTLLAPLRLGAGDVPFRVTVERAAEAATARLLARTPGSDDWTTHAEARLVAGPGAAGLVGAGGADQGELSPAASSPGEPWSGERSPAAVPVDLTGVYATLAGLGYDYGPAFQGLRALWRDGEHLAAEVDLPSGAAASLLDAAMHGWIVAGPPSQDQNQDQDGTVDVPHIWRDVRLFGAPGIPAGPLRVRITPTGPRSFSLAAVDAAGRPAISVGELALHPVDEALLRGTETAQPTAYEVAWSSTPLDESFSGDGIAVLDLSGDAGALRLPFPVRTAGQHTTGAPDITGGPVTAGPLTDGSVIGGSVIGGSIIGGPDATGEEPAVLVVVPPGGASDDDGPAAAARVGIEAVRRLVVTAAERTRLVVVTRSAVAVGDRDAVPALAAAPLWGLVRTAQTEYPGRISVIDVDGAPASLELLPAAIASGHRQLALRAGAAYRPRLRPMRPGDAPARPEALGTGTVLVTGAGGALGEVVTRHLVTAHGARRLLLISRRGEADPALRALAENLRADGAQVRVAACDLADAEAARALLAGLDTEHPLRAVVHTAGVLADATLASMTADQLDQVLRPKIDAGWNLHRLTAGLRLDAFVLFSSVAGIVGNAGQGAYAAANTFLDALAAHRRAAGLAATSLAWGPWENGMAGGLSRADRSRIDRLGLVPLTVDDGLALLDQALRVPAPSDPADPSRQNPNGQDLNGREPNGTVRHETAALLVPTRFDVDVLGRQAGDLPAMLAELAARAGGGAARPAGPGTAPNGSGPATAPSVTLSQLVAGLDGAAARGAVEDVVLAQIVEVLGLAGRAAVPADRGLFDIGFDSLTALELRNRLGAQVGLRLPTTLLFDHPTARALVDHLTALCVPADDFLDLGLLDSLVAATTALPDDDERRGDLARALRAALRTLDVADGDSGADRAFGMDSASDDEIFGLLDRELKD